MLKFRVFLKRWKISTLYLFRKFSHKKLFKLLVFLKSSDRNKVKNKHKRRHTFIHMHEDSYTYAHRHTCTQRQTDRHTRGHKHPS